MLIFNTDLILFSFDDVDEEYKTLKIGSHRKKV